ncbi:fumarylacetoacetate hydrolase family protein [Nocardioides acrostichi]|uniref:Fumarylacetoacetate hydrolase family protein n=1 Tax=Nocardioides acrostichi TaxID=2784339 RepID=A0A930UYU1_9ACTN|nr:fumarylacetoacetate hydrolase family protein [Nocardioides acrostichi]MBF4160756.1 fumarylacetoacetate hydrolase family protein [Nocardioides acrostichi]
MRWVRYSTPGDERPRLGIVVGDTIRGGLHGELVDLLAATEIDAAGHRLADEPAEQVAVAEASLLTPLPAPPSIRDFMVFEQHVEGMAMLAGAEPPVPDVWYDQPLYYFSNPTSVIGAFDEVAVPPGCTAFDFELEIAAVVGTSAANPDLADLTIDEARDAVAGYVLMNDWTARDLQGREMQGPLGPCKGKDSAITLGPWFVTADELPGLVDGITDVTLSVDINGERFGTARLDAMAWSFAEMASYASRGTRLRPGDVLGSGTCGDGCLAEHWGRHGRGSVAPLKPGDVVSLGAGPLGETSNVVVEGAPVRQRLARRVRT